MSALARNLNGYLDATRSTGNPRDVEYQLFSRVTGRLNRAIQPNASFAELAAALDENSRLWREIALDVAAAENGLPQGLRAQLFYLYEFTAAHTQKVLRNQADASALIDVNTSIMRGLRSRNPGKGPDQCLA
jgi:flagellar protein FlaF